MTKSILNIWNQLPRWADHLLTLENQTKGTLNHSWFIFNADGDFGIILEWFLIYVMDVFRKLFLD